MGQTLEKERETWYYITPWYVLEIRKSGNNTFLAPVWGPETKRR